MDGRKNCSYTPAAQGACSTSLYSGRTGEIIVKKNWIALSVLAVAVAFSASTVFACGEQAQAADTKDAKTVAATAETKSCDKPCCAHADAAVADKNAVQPAGEKPCSAAAAKGCPKKAAATTTAVAKAEPAVDPGTQR